MDKTPQRIGLVAGGGRFPILVAEGARAQGLTVVTAGLRGQTAPELRELSERFRYFALGRLGAVIRYFKRSGVTDVTWAGWIRKDRIFRPWRILSLLPDWRMIRLYLRLRNRQDATLLTALASEFESEGLHLMHSVKYRPDLLAPEGVLTRRKPTPAQTEDILFGWKVARRMAELDVGQSVVVFEKATISVEAIEGTDRNIRRAGELCRKGGFTVVKLAKAAHDMRFDIPAVGVDTIETIHAAGGRVLAVECGRTLLIDRERMIALADQKKIVVLALRDGPDGPILPG